MIASIKRAAVLAGAVLFASPASAQLIADTIYSGGTILTIHDAQPSAEAVAVKDGRILAVGSLLDIAMHQGATTELFDLDGRAMLPGFVDSHGHAVMGGLQALSANLLAAPDGDITEWNPPFRGPRRLHVAPDGNVWVPGFGSGERHGLNLRFPHETRYPPRIQSSKRTLFLR